VHTHMQSKQPYIPSRAPPRHSHWNLNNAFESHTRSATMPSKDPKIQRSKELKDDEISDLRGANGIWERASRQEVVRPVHNYTGAAVA
jgi:hypothetical protein